MERVKRLGVMVAFAFGGLAGGAVLGAGSASACNAAPGTSCSPDQLTISPSASVVATKSGTITPNPPNYTANYTETVYNDPNNTLCGTGGGCLTWAVEVTMHTTGTDTIRSVSVSDFAGWTTDIGYTPPPTGAPGFSNPNGGIVPSLVDRTGNGSVLHWRFRSPGQEIQNGQSSVLLVIQTNATTFVPGTISTQDGVSGSDTAFSPSSQPSRGVPEVAWVPAIGVLGGAIAGGFLYRRRRRAH